MIALWLVGCVAGSSLPPRQFDVTVVDPDGVEWLAPLAGVELLRFTDPACALGSWVDLHGGEPQVQAWVGYSSSGTLASDSFYVGFFNEDGALLHMLRGGVGSLVSKTDTTLEYLLDEAQDCTHLSTEDVDVCAVQAAPVTILVEGDVGELGGDPNPGWPDGVDGSGAPVCGGEQPGG